MTPGAFQELFLQGISAWAASNPSFQDEAAQDEAAALAQGLAAGAAGAKAVSPQVLPACAHLQRAIAEGRHGPQAALAEAVGRLAPALRWTYGYPDHAQYPGLAERIAFCEIVGPQAIRSNAQVRLGLTLVTPETVYPAHAHPAVEIYLVISGTALWQAGEEAARRRPPGSVIRHPANISHAMATFSEPLLAAWSWSGDIVTPPAYTG